MKDFHEAFLGGQETALPGKTIPNLPAKKVARRRGPRKKVLKQKAAAQPRDSQGKFKPGHNFVTRLFQVAQGQHKPLIKRSRAAVRRASRAHNNNQYNAGVPVIPQSKKPVKRRRRKPAAAPKPIVSEYRQSVLSSLLPWNWGKKK